MQSVRTGVERRRTITVPAAVRDRLTSMLCHDEWNLRLCLQGQKVIPIRRRVIAQSRVILRISARKCHGQIAPLVIGVLALI